MSTDRRVPDSKPEFALSVRQPWATLILIGVKTVEIRRWSTPIRGRIFLHAGKIADDRVEGWTRVPDEFRHLTDLRGGLVGTVDLVDCLAYRTPATFRRHCQLHLNDPSWFRPPVLYGFQFERPQLEDFRTLSGQVKFFTVPPVLVSQSPKSPLPRRVVHPLQSPGRRKRNPVRR